jgi:hypothetical protein
LARNRIAERLGEFGLATTSIVGELHPRRATQNWVEEDLGSRVMPLSPVC